MSNSRYDYHYIVSGIIGALILLYGNNHHYPQPYYIIGSLFLLLTAFHFNLTYFIALELILVAGHSAILLGIGPNTQSALPIFLCIQLLIFYLMVGKETLFLLLIGISGIALLAFGFAFNNQWIFFSGSSFVAIYAYYNGYQGQPASYIWAITNTLFSFMALYKLFFY
ncbi:hypothetical protein [Legionella worsleiensis]|uniref:Transmembrane protein n=1 Tax=Legionella worsleiensis TaxID=45076 RepID=A0A0W1A6E6_9GAMM|nr:hypothetical protein [Legionella worsleiensis]KTD76951.1 hypothetical protein Lwor_2176 [Legionella worsleiensis]STY33378.1 Uncharacterised protein [Legionella worsleiensis]